MKIKLEFDKCLIEENECPSLIVQCLFSLMYAFQTENTQLDQQFQFLHFEHVHIPCCKLPQVFFAKPILFHSSSIILLH